jgi:signal peptidase I
VTQTKKPLLRSAAELVLIVVVALGLALGIQAFVIKPYEIPSASMEPTLHISQRILVDRIGSHFSSPQIGDISRSRTDT